VALLFEQGKESSKAKVICWLKQSAKWGVGHRTKTNSNVLQ